MSSDDGSALFHRRTPDPRASQSPDNYGYATPDVLKAQKAPKPQPPKKNICKRIIGWLWLTRHTENVEKNNDLHAKATLKELFVYCCFLALITFVTLGMSSSTKFYYTQSMANQLKVYTMQTDSFLAISTKESFWTYMQGTFCKAMYWEHFYNNDSVPLDDRGYIFYENKLLGVPRIRQVRVEKGDCKVINHMAKVISSCYPTYASKREEKTIIGAPVAYTNTTAWNWNERSTSECVSTSGVFGKYGCSGYYQDLSTNSAGTKAILSELQSKDWIGRSTRAIMIDFSLFNANINLFCVVKLLIEFPASGGVITTPSLKALNFLRYVTFTDFLIFGCEIAVILFSIYYLVEELIEIYRNGFRYFRNFWNVLDVGVILCIFAAIVFNTYRTLSITSRLDELIADPNAFTDFGFFTSIQSSFNSLISITLFLAWIKLFKYISFSKSLTQLTMTVVRSAPDLGSFAFMFAIFFIGFSQFGYLMFGTQMQDFSTMTSTVFTLFRCIVGDFDFYGLQAAHRIIGPLFFIVYIFLIFFVLLNMFLAIINDSYTEVKTELARERGGLEMSDFFKQRYDRVLTRLRLKDENIRSIQNSLQTADANDDELIDYQEWRDNLKEKGFAESEIQSIFAQYDKDGDRVLNQNEQSRMQTDLQGQRDELRDAASKLDQQPTTPEPDRGTPSRAGTSQGAMEADSSDEEEGNRTSVPTHQPIGEQQMNSLSFRVGKMENETIGLVEKIEHVLVKMETMEKNRLKRRNEMQSLFENLSQEDSLDEGGRQSVVSALEKGQEQMYDHPKLE